MLIQKLRDRVSKPEPAMRRLGYWVGGCGVALTITLGGLSFAIPQMRGSLFTKVPPCLILAGLALEGYEAIAANRKGGNDDLSN
jgi:hypothetical protein